MDSRATNEYEFIQVGVVYNEALLDIEGNYNAIPDHCYLLLIQGQPFYIKKEYLCRIDEEMDETRKLCVCHRPIFLN